MKCPEKYIKAYLFFLLSNALSSNLKMLNTTDDEDKVHIISPVPRESPFRLPVKKRKVGTYRHTKKKNSTPWVAGLNCEYKLMLENNSILFIIS
jgi:hypothetical protein